MEINLSAKGRRSKEVIEPGNLTAKTSENAVVRVAYSSKENK